MFNEELIAGTTETLVNLDKRVGELERKETLTVGDGAGPFRYELHVSQDGRGTFETIGAACDYVAAQANVGSFEWIIWVHAGFYIEDVITVPEFTTIEGIGGDVFVRHSSIFLGSSFFTAGDFATFRNLRISQGLSSDTEDAFVIDAGDGLTLDRCTITARWQGIGQGDVNPTGTIRAVGGGHRFFGCELLATNQTDAEWFCVYINAIDADDNPSFIRSCRIWLDPEGLYFENGTSIYFDGPDEELYLLETTILGRDTGDPGNDIIAAGVGATIWLRATNYNKGTGTINYMYAAGVGTVTSVALDGPNEVLVSGSPVAGSGTLAFAWVDQAANTVFAGPASGVDDVPAFRVLVEDDIPLLSPSKIDGGVVLGTGVADRMVRWVDTDTIAESTVLYDNGSRIWAYTALPKAFPIAGFTLAHGSPNTGGGGPSAQIAFEFEGSSGGGYSHFIKSRHNGDVTGLQNEILFYINNSNTATGSSAPGTGNRLTLRLSAFDGATIGDPSGTALDLRVTGDTQLDGDLTIAGAFSPASVGTGTGAGNTLLFRAYDVDAAAYINFFTLTANNAPTADLHTDVTIDGDYIYRAGGTDIPIADGGTGASTASDARTNLGLVAGGAGDIWVEKAGDTMTGTLILPALEVATAAGSNPVADFRDADFSGNAFGTLFSPTIASDAIGRVSPFGVGGLVFNGFAAGTTTVVPLSLAGYSTTTGTTTVPAVLVIGWKSNGTNLRQALAGSEILLQVQTGISTSYTSGTFPLTLYANGNMGLSVQPAARLDVGGGTIRLAEMTAPSAPAANSVLLYAEDNGSGKTRLMALFSSGAAQQVAIQP